MALHLQKLCVGCESIQDLAEWIDETLANRRARGLPVEQVHTTRMAPKRVEELLDGGSLYWVIKGVFQVRQKLTDIRNIRDSEGISRCQLVLDRELVTVETFSKRPFQGWRYLEPKDAPRDLSATGVSEGLPPEMARELRALGLL